MTTIAIVGLGVVGGSFAKALRKYAQSDIRILAIDRDAQTLEAAIAEGVIDGGEQYNQTVLQEADIVIIALYPQALKEFVKTHRHEFKTGAIVTDTAGVKGALMREMQADLPPQVDFIFGHPMAGRESSGYTYADAAVFAGANYLLTPIESNQPKNVELLQNLLKQLGFKRVSLVTPEKHDEMIAFTSQLTHAIAVSLINSDDPERDTIHYIGDSYRDLTRIAKINASLWSELFQENKAELVKAINEFEREFQKMKKAIESDDYETLQALFRESTKRRQMLEATDRKKR